MRRIFLFGLSAFFASFELLFGQGVTLVGSTYSQQDALTRDAGSDRHAPGVERGRRSPERARENNAAAQRSLPASRSPFASSLGLGPSSPAVLDTPPPIPPCSLSNLTIDIGGYSSLDGVR